MKRRLLYLVIIVFTAIVFIHSGSTAASEKEDIYITYMTKWIGKYPFDKIKGTSIFSIKKFNALVSKVLGLKKHREFLAIERRGPQTPIKKTEDFLHFTICEAHNCGHIFYFFINYKNPNLFICERVFDFGGDNSSDFTVSSIWYGTKGSVKINNRQCVIFDEVSQNTDWIKAILSIPKEIL